MRTCPKCGRQFTDDLSYCLEDGSRLSGQPTDGLGGSPTAQYGPVTAGREDISTLKTLESGPGEFGKAAPKQYRLAAVEPTSRMGCIVTVGQVGLGLILVAGLGLAGFYYVNNKGGV
ncbi:MAG: hypothetical protein ABI539_00695, partial [Acidobacteriota bacterium]